MDTLSSEQKHPETLEETAPYFLVDMWNKGTHLLTMYGWYIFAVILVIVYYWERIQSYFERRYKEQSDKEYEAKCKKNPELMQERLLKMEAARRKMQEENDIKAALHAEKLKEKEERKRAEILSLSTSGGRRLGDRNPVESSDGASKTSASSVKKAHRPEYNPLMGSGGSGGYRPQRRGCPGGGCG